MKFQKAKSGSERLALILDSAAVNHFEITVYLSCISVRESILLPATKINVTAVSLKNLRRVKISSDLLNPT